MTAFRLFHVFSWLLVVIWWPTSAAAQSDTGMAVSLAYQGKERFEAGDYSAALSKFQQARTHARSPVFDLYVARSLKALGRWKEALQAYDQALAHDETPENVSFSSARDSARAERQDLQEELPRLTVAAPLLIEDIEVQVTLDGRSLAWPVEDVLVDPGRHVLSAQFGEQRFDQALTFSPGQQIEQSLPFSQVRRSPEPLTKVEEERPARKQGLKTAMWASFGVALVTGITGATTGIMTLADGRNWRGYCETGDCDEDGKPAGDDRAEWQRARAVARVADVALITAGVATAVGVTLLIVDLEHKKKDRRVGSVWTLRSGGSALLLRGTF